MVRVLAAGGCIAVLCGCTSSIAVTPPSASPSSGTAATPAATLRVHVDLLLGEHVFTIAKLAVAAAAGRPDEYHSYAGMLAANGVDVESLFRTALGETAGGQFGDAWTEQNNDLVDYVVAAATHDQAAASKAASNLTTSYVQHAAAVLASGLSLSTDTAAGLASGHANALKAIIDDAVAGNFTQLHADIAQARVQALSFGDTVATQVAHDFTDRFPGDPLAAASTMRTNLNSLMQQQGYVMTMASAATVAGSDTQASAAAASLNASAEQLAALYGGPAWKDVIPLVVSYAKTGDASARQSILATGPTALAPGLTALVQVMDDQRNKQFASVAIDDRAMAAAFAIAADDATLTTSPSPSS